MQIQIHMTFLPCSHLAASIIRFCFFWLAVVSESSGCSCIRCCIPHLQISNHIGVININHERKQEATILNESMAKAFTYFISSLWTSNSKLKGAFLREGNRKDRTLKQWQISVFRLSTTFYNCSRNIMG